MEIIKEQIIKVAKSFVSDQSWPWIEPVEVQLRSLPSGEKVWSVRTNMYAKGRNVRLIIRESDFSVVDSAYLPR
jgi:hypothetical protein